jgi:hypothetical protein
VLDLDIVTTLRDVDNPDFLVPRKDTARLVRVSNHTDPMVRTVLDLVMADSVSATREAASSFVKHCECNLDARSTNSCNDPLLVHLERCRLTQCSSHYQSS